MIDGRIVLVRIEPTEQIPLEGAVGLSHLAIVAEVHSGFIDVPDCI